MEVIMALLTLILVVVTAYYAWLTNRLAKASEKTAQLMKEQADSISRPRLIVSLLKWPNEPFIYLRVENIGMTSAENLTLKFGSDFGPLKDLEVMKKLSQSRFFKTTIKTYPPKSPVFFYIGQGSSLAGNASDTTQPTFTITASYSFSGNTVSESTIVDLNQYDETALEKDIVVDALTKIKEAIIAKKM